mgnify:CR=1 FL=1
MLTVTIFIMALFIMTFFITKFALVLIERKEKNKFISLVISTISISLTTIYLVSVQPQKRKSLDDVDSLVFSFFLYCLWLLIIFGGAYLIHCKHLKAIRTTISCLSIVNLFIFVFLLFLIGIISNGFP